jgi:hypothetical protein
MVRIIWRAYLKLVKKCLLHHCLIQQLAAWEKQGLGELFVQKSTIPNAHGVPYAGFTVQTLL